MKLQNDRVGGRTCKFTLITVSIQTGFGNRTFETAVSGDLEHGCGFWHRQPVSAGLFGSAAALAAAFVSVSQQPELLSTPFPYPLAQ
jgi:hypothetical protein